jgi:hypothetical protein
MTKTWTVTLHGKTQTYEQDVPGGKVYIEHTTMYRDEPVFLAGLEKMRAAGAVIVESTR